MIYTASTGSTVNKIKLVNKKTKKNVVWLTSPLDPETSRLQVKTGHTYENPYPIFIISHVYVQLLLVTCRLVLLEPK